jgi:RNA polymerase subunit RPABC4/transcription elongation factor Spt4
VTRRADLVIIDVVAAARQAAAGRNEIRLTAPLSCPSCGRGLTGRWLAGRETAAQQCRACGEVFTTTWPGFRFEPETEIVRAAPSP